MNSLKLPRNPLWADLRRRWIKDHPTCAACGCRKNLEVHHKVPVHVSRVLELDPSNLITLCETDGDKKHHCHLNVGHLGNWYSYNKNVDQNARELLLKTYPIQTPSGQRSPDLSKPVAPLSTTPEIPPVDAATSAIPVTETSPLQRVKRPRQRR